MIGNDPEIDALKERLANVERQLRGKFTPSGYLDPQFIQQLTGDVRHRAGTQPVYLALSGFAVTASNGDNDDLATQGLARLRITGPTAAFAVTGFSDGYAGRMLTVYNATNETMTIKNEDTGSAAANRILTLTGADVALRTDAPSSATFVYDETNERWILTAVNGL